jgi:hypothetical protein
MLIFIVNLTKTKYLAEMLILNLQDNTNMKWI